ncbi:cytochrome P450 [Bradyrhizobium japonicum]|uniref:cytochrome P450 n=1 Tax=Bradyrhizobium japonicum TaxID=375 RepID=UPI0027155D09|nr:cytochrome P450 [Bradyrhizobium japonicum]WLB53895.1 cytochrome P450 [Bradyrhizobium japonicum]WLB64232.1 cytochrome P450 [Bradyrhizobium japonicum]
MRASNSQPDALPPGVRRLSYGLFCWLNRHIIVLRGIGALLRYWPFVGGWFGVAARASAVRDVMTRPRSFSNTAHAPNLTAGDYLIAMDPGPTYDADKILLDARLDALKPTLPASADQETQRLVTHLKTHVTGKPFDLIEDYLMWIVFRAMDPLFGSATDRVAAGAHGSVHDPGLKKQYLMEIRYVAGQLLAGGLATLRVQRRAELCADALRARIAGVSNDIQQAWKVPASPDLERNAVGLAWISHPVTVQSGALVVQELLQRPEAHKALRDEAAKLGDKVWQCGSFRNLVRNHVFELMRFRPIFPLLARDVPRDTEFQTGARRNAPCPGGRKMTVLSIAAMFDQQAIPDIKQFCPSRDWGKQEDLRWLMFGYGTRQCPARAYAVEILTSALIGLLILPELQLADRERKAVTYDGALMSGMSVRFVSQEGKDSHA